LIAIPAFAQQESRREQLGEILLSGGSYRGSIAFSYTQQWRLGAQRRFGAGIGLRATGFLGANLNYITAPAKLTSGSTGPLIFFKEDIEENLDTLLIPSPQVNFVNLMISLDYNISSRFTAGFNIDAIGFSFGAKQRSNFMTNNRGKNVNATPTTFNILLISDNDRGSLNSELYFRYAVAERWLIKAAAQFMFTEYTTEMAVQEFPEKNDRFRNKSLLFGLGITKKF
jgi:hypothetical protein